MFVVFKFFYYIKYKIVFNFSNNVYDHIFSDDLLRCLNVNIKILVVTTNCFSC